MQKLNGSIRSSAFMALAMGIFLPILETIRRSNQILNPKYFIHWFDDYLLGAILLIAALMVFRQKKNASLYLVAAWGMAAGTLLMSFLYQIDLYFNPGVEPGVFSKDIVALVKGLIVAYTWIGLWKSIQAQQEEVKSEGEK